jgi:hypothetical protein
MMRPIYLTGCLLAMLMGACGDPKAAPSTPTTGSTKPMTIEKQAIADAIESGGIVCLIEVKDAEVIQKGTRSESARITATAKQAPLFGKAEGEVKLRIYTSKGNTVLNKGKSYIVAGGKDPRFAPAYDIYGFVEVTSQNQAGTIEANRKLVEAVLAEKKK